MSVLRLEPLDAGLKDNFGHSPNRIFNVTHRNDESPQLTGSRDVSD